MSTTPRIFISYARSDGETFANDLRVRLEREHPELTLWQDRQQMEGLAVLPVSKQMDTERKRSVIASIV